MSTRNNLHISESSIRVQIVPLFNSVVVVHVCVCVLHRDENAREPVLMRTCFERCFDAEAEHSHSLISGVLGYRTFGTARIVFWFLPLEHGARS